ncbi:MAG TPA: kelch repeat-containing protein, partial [Bacteroidia bacterium]|nr:kelch repeat-containing protein [Bacteroidia bacterium]
AGFSIGALGYAGTGEDVNGYTNDFYVYDPSLNSWTAVTSFPGAARTEGVGFSISGLGYIGTGQVAVTGAVNDFYQYDPNNGVGGSWISVAPIPVERSGAVGLALSTRALVGSGKNNSGALSDFYSYDSNTDSWTSIASIPGGNRFGATGFAINGIAYVGMGTDGTNYPSDFYGYESTSNSWNRIADYPTTAVKYSTGFSIGAFGFTFLGDFGTPSYTNGAWKYIPAASGDYRSAQTGAWSDLSSWEVFDGVSWIPASHIPTNADGTITIRNGHTINFDNDVIDADELIVRAGATFYGIEGALHVHDGAGIDFRCDGIFSIATSQITVDGAIQFTSNSVFTWGSGGFNGTGTIEVLNGFNWFLNSGDHTLDGCTFTNYGYAHLQGGNLVFRGSDPHFINQSIFEVASSFDMVNDGASNAWFENGNTGSISALTSTTVNIPANVRFTTDGSMFLYGSEIHFESLSDPLMGNIGIMDIDAQIVSEDVVRFAGPEMVNNGHFIAPDLQMVGSGMQYIYGSGPYQKISTISAVGINAFTTLNIDGELNLVNGNVFTTVANGAVVHLTASSVISYSGVHPPRIIGALQRDITTSGPVDFPVGGAAAEDYAPIVINPDVTSPGSLTVTTQQGDHYAEILSRLISSKSVNRTWSITNNGLGYSSCEITFNWDSADVDAGTIYGNFGVGEWRAASWAYPVANSVTATSITVTGVILSAEYAVAELEPQQDPGTYRTYADGDWNDVANWLVYDGNTWLPASTPPDNSSVAVQVHHKMVVNSPASGNNVVVENAPATVFDAGWGATLTVNSSLTLLHSGNHPDLLVLGDANPNGRVKVELNSGGSIGGDNAQDSIVVRGELDAGNATAYLYLSGGTILNTIDGGLFDQVGGHVRALPGTSTIQCDIHVDGTEFWISGG